MFIFKTSDVAQFLSVALPVTLPVTLPMTLPVTLPLSSLILATVYIGGRNFLFLEIRKFRQDLSRKTVGTVSGWTVAPKQEMANNAASTARL